MNMSLKKLCLLSVVMSSLTPIRAAVSEALEWKARLRVVDDAGQPVAGAKVWVSYMYTNQLGGLTDADGVFATSHRDISPALAFHAEKPGYYPIWLRHEMGRPEHYDAAKWNPVRTLVLKRILRPIPMLAKRLNLGIPAFDRQLGFDLAAGSWVGPYGPGSNTDVVFTAHLDKSGEENGSYRLVVTFPNAGDGIQQFRMPPQESGGELRSPHEAPAVGYRPEWVQSRDRTPGHPETGNFDPNRSFFFRVRTVLDERGNVKSALYGKIYGDFMQFTYYLNPTPNDRNIEFDPKRNLMRGSKGTAGLQP